MWFYDKRMKQLDSYLRVNAGLFLDKKGRPNDALMQYMKAIEIDPYNLHALTNMGVLCAKMEEPALAERFFRQALFVNKHFPAAIQNLQVLKDGAGE